MTHFLHFVMYLVIFDRAVCYSSECNNVLGSHVLVLEIKYHYVRALNFIMIQEYNLCHTPDALFLF